MPIDPTAFRMILGHYATGVAVVTTREPGDGGPRGLTVNAFASVSLDPPLVLVCVDLGSETHDPIGANGRFAVNVLAEGGAALADRFAGRGGTEKFEGVSWREEATGSPVLDEALAWVDCTLWARYPGGDHTIFVGEVVAGGVREGEPLLYYRGGYGRFTS